MGSKSGCGTVPEGMAESSGFSVQIDRLLRALESEILAAHEKEVTAANEEPVQPPPSETATDRVKLPLPPAFAECSETADPSTVHPKPGESESAATSSNHTPIKRYAPNLKLTLSE
ncbi:KCNH6, partial [Symbiodinium microadriaticum]